MPNERNTGGEIPDRPRQEWYYRENAGDALVGPMDFHTAEQSARRLSEDEDRSGLAELVTRVGARAGDPARAPARFYVVYMYIRGKRVLGGRTAEFHSTRGLPPTT